MADEDVIQPDDTGIFPTEEEEDQDIEEEEEGGEEDQGQEQQSKRRRSQRRRPRRRPTSQQQKQPSTQEEPTLTAVPVQPKAESTKKPGTTEPDQSELKKVKPATIKSAAIEAGQAVKKLAKQPKELAKQIGREIKNLPREIVRDVGRTARKTARRVMRPKQTLRAMGRLGKMKLTGRDLGIGAKGIVKPAIGSVYRQAKTAAQSVPGAMLGALGGQDKQDRAASQTAQTTQQLAQEAAEIPEKIREALDTPRKIRETIKDIKEIPGKIKKTVKAIKKAPQKIKQAVKVIEKVPQAGIRTARVAARVAVRVTQQIIKQLPRIAKVTGLIVKGIAATWWIWLIIAIIALIVWLVLGLFGGGSSYNYSSMGGSAAVPADFNNPIHRQIVDNLKQKMEGCDPKLVIYDEGKENIDWQVDTDGEIYHDLDIRILKTLDYLTDKHDRIMVGLLKTGAPLMIRESHLVDIDVSKAIEEALTEQLMQSEADQYFSSLTIKQGTQGYELWHNKMTVSTYNMGQAMAILEIDRSENPKLPKIQDNCGVLVPPPIEVAWQDTLKDGGLYTFGSNDEVRTLWEELSNIAGFLDRNLPTYKALSIASQAEINRIRDNIRSQLDINPTAYQEETKFDIYTETFFKIQRGVTLIDKIINRGGSDKIISAVALNWFTKALANFDDVNQSLNIDTKILEGGRIPGQTWENTLQKFDEIGVDEWNEKIKSLSKDEIITKLNNGIGALYNALNVANMVGWNDTGAPLAKQKAFEARQKIRQTILELERMPNETYLEPPAANQTTPAKDLIHFDSNLVVKQIITYSPEDDLDNGQEQIDIFPRGLIAVGENGTAFDPTLKDDEINYFDVHFSHAPIDNGVFSLEGIQFVFMTLNSFWGSKIPPGTVMDIGDIDKLSILSIISRLTGNNYIGDTGHYFVTFDSTGRPKFSQFDQSLLSSQDMLTVIPVSFQKFLHVAF